MKPDGRGRLWASLARALAALAFLAYPVVVWRGLAGASPRWIALILLCVMAPAILLRWRGSASRASHGLVFLPFVTVILLGLAGLLNSLGLVLFVPVAINGTLLLVFGSSLRPGSRPLVERFARLKEKVLSTEQIEWCRRWTRIWCGFFVANGGTAALLAWLAPLSWWAFYNGFLAYLLIAALLAGEWVLRVRRFPAAPEDEA